MANDDDPTSVPPGPSRLSPNEILSRLEADMELARQDAIQCMADEEAERTGKS
jgi:hypothetical protein